MSGTPRELGESRIVITDLVLALSLITLIVLGTRVLSFAGQSRAALFFGFYCYVAAFITIAEIMVHHATSVEVARAWGQVAAVWPLAWVSFAVFAAQSVGPDRYRRPALGVISLAAVAIAISYFLLARRGTVVAEASDFGYVLESPFIRTPLGIVVAVSYSLIPVLTLILLVRAASRSNERSRRRQVRWILLAYGLGFVVGVGLVLLREVGGFQVREVNGFSYLATAGTIYLGIVRKHLIHLSPELVAQQALNQIDECFCLTDERYRIVSVNAAASQLVGLPRRDLVGTDLRHLLGVDTDSLDSGDVRIERNGTTTVVNLSQTATRNHLGEIVGRVIVGHDATDARRREERLRGLVSEKNLLVQELHHRVRNTLQLISALVSLKAARLVSDDAIGVFRDVTERIDLIARVYNDIYAEGELSRIPLDRALRDVSDRLSTRPGKNAAPMELDLDPIEVSTERAIPIVLCVAELVANAIQHAYPDGRSGAVRIASERASEKAWSVVVSDDGIGIVGDPPTGAVGLMLAHELARQIDGSLVTEGGPGTTWRLTIPLPI